MKKEIVTNKGNNKHENKVELIAVIIVLILLIISAIYVIFAMPKQNLHGEDKQALISPSVSFSNTANGNSINLKAKFTYYGSKKFYYVTRIYKNEKLTYTYQCVPTQDSRYNPASYTFTQNTTPTYYEITTYTDAKCTQKKRVFKSKTFKSSTNNNNNNNNSGSTSKLTITYTPNGATMGSNGTVKVSNPADYSTKVTITNPAKKTYYYRWFTYLNQNINETPSYFDASCTSFNSTITRTVGLTINRSYPARAGQIKVYSTEAACKSDTKSTSQNNVIAKKTILYTLSNVVSILKTPSVNPNSSGISVVTKTGDYSTTFTLNNTTGKTYYYRWFTYASFDTSKAPSYNEATCAGFNSTKKISSTSLSVSTSYPNRTGVIKVYSNLNSCRSDNNGKSNTNVAATSTTKFQLKKVFNNNDGFKELIVPSDYKSRIGTQTNTKQNCFSYAMAYGVYILSNGTKKASINSTSWGSYNWGTYTAINGNTTSISGIWSLITKKINSGIPVVLHVRNSNSSSHWVTVYGYKTSVKSASNESTLLNSIKVLDPWNGQRGIPSGIATSKKLHSDRNTRTWK